MKNVEYPDSLLKALDNSNKPIHSTKRDAVFNADEEIIKAQLMNLEDRNIVISNELIFSAQPMSTVEARILRVVLSQIENFEASDHEIDSKEFPVYRVKVSDLSDKLFKRKGNSLHRQLEEACVSLQTRSLFFKDKSKDKWVSYSWTSYAAYEGGVLYIKLNPDLYDFLNNLKTNFSQYPLELLLLFKSKYSLRLYEALYAKIFRDKRFRNKYKEGWDIEVPFDIDELRLITATINLYPVLTGLKTRVIEPAIKEISEYTDIQISRYYTEKRNGSKTDTVVFVLCSKSVRKKLSSHTEEIVFVDTKKVLDDAAVLDSAYILKIFGSYDIDCEISSIIRLIELYGQNTAVFNQYFRTAITKATNNVAKYMIKMAENGQKDNDEGILLPLSDKKSWLTPEFEETFDQIFDYWNEKALNSEVENILGVKEAKYKTEKMKRCLHELIGEGITLDEIKAAIDTANQSIYLINTDRATLSYFLIADNFKKIANGDEIADGYELFGRK